MINKTEHPSIKKYHERKASGTASSAAHTLSASDLKQMCLELGAADVGIVEIDRAALAAEKQIILANFGGIHQGKHQPGGGDCFAL